MKRYPTEDPRSEQEQEQEAAAEVCGAYESCDVVITHERIPGRHGEEGKQILLYFIALLSSSMMMSSLPFTPPPPPSQ